MRYEKRPDTTPPARRRVHPRRYDSPTPNSVRPSSPREAAVRVDGWAPPPAGGGGGAPARGGGGGAPGGGGGRGGPGGEPERGWRPAGESDRLSRCHANASVKPDDL